MNRKALTVASISIAIAAVGQLAFAAKGGTSILHFMVRATMTGAGTGSVEAKRNQQGGADNQRLAIHLSNLDAEASYQLFANGSLAAEFVTDSDGNAELNYVKKNKGKSSPGGDPLPAELDPISSIHTLEIAVDGTPVLSATLNSGQYLIKRTFTNDDVDEDAAATLRIKSNGSTDQLRIRASGLDANGTYDLAINGSVAATYSSDANGNLSINAWPDGSPAALDVTSLEILNADSDSVLSTLLP